MQTKPQDKYFMTFWIKHFSMLLSVLLAAIFSLRWRNALPFSGYMPVLKGGDQIEIWSRFLIYAREPFHYPLGLIKGLSYPFETANIVRGPLELFAIPLKLLSKVVPAAGQFYYFSLAEILSVFLTAFFASKIFEQFGVRSLWVRGLGTVLVTLSFPLLFRSSYSQLSYQVVYFAFYMIFAYVYIRFYRDRSTKLKWWLAALLPLSAMVDYYLVLALAGSFLIFVMLHGIEAALSRERLCRKRFVHSLGLLALAVGLTYGLLLSLGNEKNLVQSNYFTPLTGRYESGWGYGGGMGGGFHSADLLTFVIPPENKTNMPEWKKVGPDAFLTKLGVGFTTIDLQDGQYEGFTYIGTVGLFLVLMFLLIYVVRWLRNPREEWQRRRVVRTCHLHFDYPLFSLPCMFAIACGALFILSLGYIVHIAGHRLNNVATPALVLAEMWPRFIFARGLGKLATPLALLIIFSTVVLLNRYVQSLLCSRKKIVTYGIRCFLGLLIAAHVVEISGYLTPRSDAIKGNDIVQVFDLKDRQTIQQVLKDKKVLIMVPALRSSADWSKIGYALAYTSQVPLTGATIGIAVPDHFKRYFGADIAAAQAGGITTLIDRYGKGFALAMPEEVAADVLRRMDAQVNVTQLTSQNVVLITTAE